MMGGGEACGEWRNASMRSQEKLEITKRREEVERRDTDIYGRLILGPDRSNCLDICLGIGFK